ncbi:uncharacterized protein G2W53_005696 [Senna tora]|uniref:Uncharacterized protein n=1 Tax=Senna tora TaxID=362788 RepID=A0A834X3I0_9FABA|nr:uncharacterized protein G2W53_005696 [Senna tora]
MGIHILALGSYEASQRFKKKQELNLKREMLV